MKKRISKLLIIVLAVSLICSTAIFSFADDEPSETRITWTLDAEGVLTISGEGPMEDYETASASPWYSDRLSIKKVIIEDGVKDIGENSFVDCTWLESVTIPDSVTSIGSEAFSGCSSLTSITIPESVTSIGEGSFSNCTSLMSITIPESVTSIGGYAFYNCRSLTSITILEGVTSIGNSAFSICSSLTNITIPESVTSIGGYAFSNCGSLTSITIPERVTSIEEWTFSDCGSLTSITIPEGVTSIGYSAFYCCEKLTSITIPEGVTSIEGWTFSDCGSLTSITIPEGVTSIGEYAFRDCTSLTNITIPEGVTSIGVGAFDCCSSLTSITIPESVTSIGVYALSDCNNIKYIFYGGTREQWWALYNSPTTGIVHYSANDHIYSEEYTVDIAPSCFQEGSKSKHCVYCDVKTDIITIPKTDHIYGEWVVIKDATCTEEGSRVRTCTVCCDEMTEQIPALGHEWNSEATIDKEPTCTEEGSKSIHCARCNEKKDEASIPALGHEWDEWVVTKDATCTEEGSKERTCIVCDDKVTEQIPALGHDWDEGVVTKGPTYTEEGELLHTCRRDATHTYAEVIPKLDKPDEPIVIRIAGSNRYATAIAAADHMKEKSGIEKFESIIIASGTGFPDALSASYLAYRKDGPILLVGGNSIDTVTDYVNANLAEGGTVYIVGGTGAVPEAVDEKIAIIHGSKCINRLAGSNRYMTNLLVLNEAGIDSQDMLVASGTGFADALSASAAKRPILLVGPALLPDQKSFLAANASSLTGSYYIIGGPGAVSQNVENAVKEYGRTTRLAGSNRYGTSIAVANQFFPDVVDTVVIANGKNFPDGLSGGPIAAAYDAPLILVIDAAYDHAQKYFADKDAFQLVIMGGTGVIADGTAGKITGGAE